jgi:hypothetical protein
MDKIEAEIENMGEERNRNEAKLLQPTRRREFGSDPPLC